MPLAFITLVLQDSDADTGNVSAFVSVETSDTVESLDTDYAHIFWDAIRPLVNGVLVGVSITLKPDFSGWTNNSPVVISDVEEKAVFTLRVCGNHRSIKLTLPTINEIIFEGLGNGQWVDQSNSDYIAFAHTLENGVVDGGIGMVDSHGVDICEVLFGEQFFGKG
jgi:hypothetical protein